MTRDPVKIAVIAVLVLIVVQAVVSFVGRSSFPHFITGFLDLAFVFVLGTFVILLTMRMKGSL